ncbi:MAG: serine/threonine protein kinase [Proteobacteria bacterium]|nr:serine/threonine protein kinase [Pseudomonadota bacterium]
MPAEPAIRSLDQTKPLSGSRPQANRTARGANTASGADWTGTRLGRYTILGELAAGGMASVCLAQGGGIEGFRRLFALKMLHPEMAANPVAVKWFLDEAWIAGQVRHYNAVSAIEASQRGDSSYYLVMEYIAGDHLRNLLRQAYRNGERMPARVAVRIVIDTLAGLEAIHDLKDSQGRPLELIHRDVSPQNILVGVDGITRLTDFGLTQPAQRINRERAELFAGKLAYMSPEHVGQETLDQRSDLFSMGVVLWESLTTARLFAAPTPKLTIDRVREARVTKPSRIRADLSAFDRVVARALAPCASARFRTAREFRAALHQACAEIGGPASRREVRWIVSQYAAEKLQRERELGRSPVMLSQPRASAPAAGPRPPRGRKPLTRASRTGSCADQVDSLANAV